jgi:hypothetical protein
MSAKSDKYEKDVAKNIDKIPGVKAERPKVGTDYPDVKVTYKKQEVWFEVKMNHTDNLSNPRVYYTDGKWHTTYTTPAAQYTVDLLNSSEQTKQFLKDIAKFSGIPFDKLKIPTTKTGLKEPGAVPLKVMKMFFNQPGVNRYIASKENYNLGKVVTEHYTAGKTAPAHYMQAGDDFYMVSSANPYKLNKKIPVLSGSGDFKVRIATRSEYYEVQAEIKIKKMPHSDYSLAPGTKKKNPFLRD